MRMSQTDINRELIYLIARLATPPLMGRIMKLRDSLEQQEKMMSTMQADEDLAAKGATAPRVSLDDIKANIRSEYYVLANKAMGGDGHLDSALSLLMICFLVTQNGYVVMGKSAPASAENFDAEKGRTFAKDDAMRQLWPLMGYALKEKLAHRTIPRHG